MKNIFLDCGTHLAQGLTSIGASIDVDDSWIVHSWEANPYTFEAVDHAKFPSNYQFHNQAISDRNGTVTLNIETFLDQDTGQGSSIIEQSKWLNPMHKGTFNKTVDVECIDISSWILNHCSMEDFVVVKFDIEGAEYSVLTKMIQDQSINLVDRLFIEWHARFFPDREKYWELQDQIIESLRNQNVDIIRWS